MMSRTPNSEQLKAIEHTGGVLLEAGAGSGKTFVLVNHIFYLLQHRYNQLDSLLSKEQRCEILRDYLSQIVMMTFTNKAAGEMASRLHQHAMQSYQEDPSEMHGIFIEVLDALNILTIDGFCSKLVKDGFFPEVPLDFNIVDEFSYGMKITNLLHKWDRIYEHKRSFEYRLLMGQFNRVVETMITIFSTPELRVLWSESSSQQMLQINWDEFLRSLMRLKGVPTTIPESPFASEFLSKNDDTSKFYQQLAICSGVNLEHFADFMHFYQLLKKIPSPDNRKGPRKDIIKDYKQEISLLRTFVLEVGDIIEQYEKNQELLSRWVALLYEIFNYIEDNYLLDNQFCFGDLEYYVYKGLQSDSITKLIENSYNYFIVDEFQDTSEIQFAILRALVRNDLSHLFAVGDKKQAIYAFRGGEVTVFSLCAELMLQQGLQVLYLKNNYRSTGRVIKFNNELFSHIFNLGVGFSGIDRYAVDVVKQEIPLVDKEFQGQVYKIDLEINADDKITLSNDDIVYLEAQAFLKRAQTIWQENCDAEICILYKALTPLKVVFPLLLESDVDFISQIKLDQDSDPINILFTFFIRFLHEQNIEQFEEVKEQTCLDIYSFLSCGVLFYLGIEIEQEQIKYYMQQAIVDESLFGVQVAFYRYCYHLGLANSNYGANFAKIESLLEVSKNQISEIYNLLESAFTDRYSIEFQRGDQGKLIIMSAHASKGLEFSHVFIGGGIINGRYIPERSLIGKFPGSLKWKSDIESKDLIDTPQFYLEKAINRAKGFAESKRLFYVVGTRAIDSLTWVDIVKVEKGKVKRPGERNSWINGLRSFEQHLGSQCEDIIDVCVEKISYPWANKINQNQVPLFHLDSVGIQKCDRRGEQEQLLLLSEMSVTSLASLSVCPKRFYLKYILKLDSHSLDALIVDDDFVDIYKDQKELADRDEIVEERKSFAERGTFIHQQLYQVVMANKGNSLSSDISPRDLKAIDWGRKQIIRYQDKELIAEVEVKFDFFGVKVSGIPDLIVIDDPQRIYRIVDYKTGRRKKEQETVYRLQLAFYAYGLLKSDKCRQDYKIVGQLLYVDQQESVEFKFSYCELADELFKEFRKLNNLTQENYQNCQFCQFRKVCPPRVDL